MTFLDFLVKQKHSFEDNLEHKGQFPLDLTLYRTGKGIQFFINNLKI